MKEIAATGVNLDQVIITVDSLIGPVYMKVGDLR